MATFFVLIAVFVGGIALGKRSHLAGYTLMQAKLVAAERRCDLYKTESAKWRKAAVRLADAGKGMTSEDAIL